MDCARGRSRPFAARQTRRRFPHAVDSALRLVGRSRSPLPGSPWFGSRCSCSSPDGSDTPVPEQYTICSEPSQDNMRPLSTLHEFILRLLPDLARLGKASSRLRGVDLSQMHLHQAEGLLDEVVKLVDRGPRINADNIEDLCETRTKVKRGNWHLL